MSLAREDPATGMVAVVRGYYRRARWKRWAIVLLSVIAVAAFLVTIVVGPVDITLPQLLRALVNPSTVDAQTRMVLWQLRIPSSVMAVLIGVCLSLAGAHMQTILDNPLAEPFTLGISAAAAFGAAASIVLDWTIIPNSQFNVAVCAAVASLVAVAIVAAVSRRREDGRESMILLGIALVFGFHALLALLQYRATPEALQQIVFWTMGSFQRATWTSNAIIAAVLAIAIPITIRHSGQLTALRLGDERAAAMGGECAPAEVANPYSGVTAGSRYRRLCWGHRIRRSGRSPCRPHPGWRGAAILRPCLRSYWGLPTSHRPCPVDHHHPWGGDTYWDHHRASGGASIRFPHPHSASCLRRGIVNIRLSNLHLSYGQRHVLDGVSLGPLERGTVTGLLGPNGAGKSTLIKAIAGLKTPTSGEVIISDDDGHVSGAQLRDVVGYLPQDVLATASLTVLESVLTSARSRSKATVERAAHVLERVGIAHIAHRFISQLSGGQRQLVALAQMVVRDPQVLLLDEPTSALDLHNQIEVLRLVRRAADSGHRMAIVALHDLNLAACYCDRLVLLHEGGVHAEGSPSEVLTPDVLERVYGFRARVLSDGGIPVVRPVVTA